MTFYYSLFVFMILGILIGIIGLSAKGAKGVYARRPAQRSKQLRRKITHTEKAGVLYGLFLLSLAFSLNARSLSARFRGSFYLFM